MSNAFTTLSLIKFKEKKYSDAEVLAAYENKKRICETEKEIKLKNPATEKDVSRLEKFYDAYITELDNAFQQIKTSEKRDEYADSLISEEKRKREESIKEQKEKEIKRQTEIKEKVINNSDETEKINTNNRKDSSLTRRVDEKYLKLQEDYVRLKSAYEALTKDRFIGSIENPKDKSKVQEETEGKVEEKKDFEQKLKFTPIVKGKFEENNTANIRKNESEEEMER